MESSGSDPNVSSALWELSASLCQLRDALSQISLILSDLQFETNLEQRKQAEQVVQRLMSQIASSQNPSS